MAVNLSAHRALGKEQLKTGTDIGGKRIEHELILPRRMDQKTSLTGFSFGSG
jgi:hypothetical protein